MTQLALDGMVKPHVVRVAADRGAPAVWVRAIRIVRTLGAGSHEVVREVWLRRGLNIIWAPPRGGQIAGEPDGVPAEAAIAGHTAGKTSFVRLLRYVLGDRHFASESVRRLVRERFPEAWVLAEVEVFGKVWGVARPLGVGSHPFCSPGATLDMIGSASKVDFRTYLDALAAAVLPSLSTSHFPDGEGAIGWEHVLPWFTRDQECRFADLVEWRHPSSASDSPSLTVDQRYFLVRAALGLVSDAEREAQERHAALLAERKRLVDRRPLLEHQGQTDSARLRRLLDVDVPPGEGLFAEASAALLDLRRKNVAECRERVGAARAERDDATGLRDAALTAAAEATRDLREAEGFLLMEEGALTALDGARAGQAVESFFADLPQGSRYCNVPMTEARARRCPLATTRVVALEERRASLTAAEEHAAQAAVVAGHRREVEARQDALRAAELVYREAHGRYMRAQTAFDDARDALREAEQGLREGERLVTFAESSWREAEQAAEDVERLTAEIEASLARQELLRQERTVALGELSAVFEHVVRELLGPGVHGWVGASGRSLSLHVERDGDRDSAALSTIKLLAFDLAALTSSIEGRGALPRILVHDGPREADLAMDIYARLFQYSRALEAASEGEPSFQYVITTTTSPPADMQREPWVRLILSGASGDARLYGMDL